MARDFPTPVDVGLHSLSAMKEARLAERAGTQMRFVRSEQVAEYKEEERRQTHRTGQGQHPGESDAADRRHLHA
jgi:hypothetical protein